MLTIIHGDNQFKSRQGLDYLKKKYPGEDLIMKDGTTLSLTDLIQTVEGGQLFGDRKIIIIENLLSRKSKTDKKIIEYLQNILPETNCVLWENKQMGKTILANFPSAKIILYKIDKQIFNFLDNLKSSNREKLLLLFHSALQYDGPELIFFMMVRQFRHLLLVKSKSNFLDSMSPWQQQKAEIQAKNFNMIQLKKIYRDLLDIDYSIKSGQSALDLTGRLDMFLLSL